MRSFCSALACAGLLMAMSSAFAESSSNVTFRSFGPGNDQIEVFTDPDRGEVVRMRSEGQIISGTPVYDTLSAASAVWRPNNITTWANITTIQAEYKGEIGRHGGGTPRFFIGLDLNSNGDYDSFYNEETDTWEQEDGHLMVLWGLGTPPWQDPFTGEWGSTGNIIGGTEPRFETGQIPGGDNFGMTYAETLAIAGDFNVVAIGLSVDGGWAMGEDNGYVQQVVIDNILFEGVLNDIAVSPVSDSGLSMSFAAQSDHTFSEVLSVPEPASAMVLLAGLMSMGLRRRRRLA